MSVPQWSERLWTRVRRAARSFSTPASCFPIHGSTFLFTTQEHADIENLQVKISHIFPWQHILVCLPFYLGSMLIDLCTCWPSKNKCLIFCTLCMVGCNQRQAEAFILTSKRTFFHLAHQMTVPWVCLRDACISQSCLVKTARYLCRVRRMR